MRPPVVKSHEIYCGNPSCSSRADGRTFTVVDTTDMSDAERVELLIDGVDSFRLNDEGERIQVSKSAPRFDGELRDGEVWLCPGCQGAD